MGRPKKLPPPSTVGVMIRIMGVDDKVAGWITDQGRRFEAFDYQSGKSLGMFGDKAAAAAAVRAQ
jgi:hypothetical protein